VSVRAAAVLIALGLVTACGSQVSPVDFYRAQGALPAGGTGSPVINAPGGSAPAGSTAGASPASTPGDALSSSATSPGASSGRPAGRSTSSASRATGSGPVARTTSATHAATSTSAAPSACKPPTASKPTVVVCPATGLHDGQTVHVYASGFQNAKPTALTPALVITECADKGNDTQQADCGALHFVNPDSNGRVSMTITVVKVVGSNKNVCGETYKCLVSVSQPKQPPDYEADQHISFG
jgi:Neocarzinostatin family